MTSGLSAATISLEGGTSDRVEKHKRIHVWETSHGQLLQPAKNLIKPVDHDRFSDLRLNFQRGNKNFCR